MNSTDQNTITMIEWHKIHLEIDLVTHLIAERLSRSLIADILEILLMINI